MKKYLFVLFLAIFIIPSIANASWYNPFSWFQKKAVQPPVVQVSIPTPAPTISTSDKQIKKVTSKKEKQNTQPTSKKITSIISTPPVIPGTTAPAVSNTNSIISTPSATITTPSGMGGGSSAPTTPTTPSTSGGGGSGGGGLLYPAMSPPTMAVPLKCSDYMSYFSSLSSCEDIKQSSSANQDGVEIDPPLYTLCMTCNPTFSPSVPVDNSTPVSPISPTTGCTSTMGFSPITAVSCQTWTK